MIFRKLRFAILSLAAAILSGCAPSKSVSISSNPDGAHLLFYRVEAGGAETQVSPGGDDPVTPANITLDFSTPVQYRVEAHRVLCMPSLNTQIQMDPQTAYAITLTQYKQYVTAIENLPVKVGEIWQIKPTAVQTVASIDPTESPTPYIDQPQPVTRNKRSDVDFPAFDVSPTTALLVYEQIQPDSSSSTGYSSRLYELALTPGEAPTLLTLGRKQQRSPAFDFSGDNIIFNSDDDSRTDSPFQFKTTDNEASISHLAHEPDLLEFGFTAGKDNIAFTSYAPNATEPVIEAASRDGFGPTPRATGLSPDLSPDGDVILFVHRPENGGKLRLCMVNTRGPNVTRELALNDDADYYQPRWSPDSQLIVFCSPSRGKNLPDDVKKEPNAKYHDAEGEHSFLWIASADGRHCLRLTKNESFDSNPVFDRNGRTIYFRSNRGGVWNIWKLNLSDAAFAELKVSPPAQ